MDNSLFGHNQTFRNLAMLNIPKFPNVRHATDADVEYIHSWLQTQSASEVPGTFMCNWNLTLGEHAKGELVVYAHPETDLAVAYQRVGRDSCKTQRKTG